MHPAVKNYPRKSYRLFEGGDPLDAGAFADLVARYDGDILYADTEVGRLLDGLERLGLEPSTAVLVTADHGEEFFDHGNWGHGQSVYDELVHVPLILRLPRGAAGGSRVAAPVSHADVVPTLLSLAAAPPDGRLPGRSLVPVTDVERGPPVYVLSELLYDYGDARALVYAGHKLVVRQEAQRRDVALYDLVTDPVERRPSAPDAPEIAVLTGELDRRIEAERLAQPTATDVPLDEDTRVRLRSLGYAR
jgi:arylsulfatase A-like enzyme